MKTALLVLQAISAILLSLIILIQSRGAGLGAVFGGGGEFYATKRGAEKIMSIATVVIAVIFILLSIFSSLIN